MLGGPRRPVSSHSTQAKTDTERSAIHCMLEMMDLAVGKSVEIGASANSPRQHANDGIYGPMYGLIIRVDHLGFGWT